MISATLSRPTSVLGRDAAAVVVLVRGDREVASWSLECSGRPDLAVVEWLARLQLAARRLGYSIAVRHAGRELVELLELCGVADVLAAPARLGVEVEGEAESGEQLGIHEVVVPDDPVP